MRKNVNVENIEGRVFEHDLAVKTVQNQQSENYGKEFINGTLSVATDEAGLNVITVHYTYVTETTKQGKPNITYANLKKIMESKTWVTDGKDAALKVRLTPSAALNDFYPQGGDQLVSQQRNEGGFVSIVSDLKPDGVGRRKFTFDTIIKNVIFVEADPEKNIKEDYAKIDAVIFNFRNDILPFTLIARSKGAIDYFMNLEASPSNPIYTQVWGEIVSTTVQIQKTIESAFGEPTVDVTERQQKEWVITGAKPEPYVFGDAETITAEELTKAIADRNVYLEDVKARAKEYYNARGSAEAAAIAANTMPAPNTNIPVGGFSF